MSIPKVYGTKAPTDDLDFAVNLRRWRQVTVDNPIVSAEVSASPSGLSLGAPVLDSPPATARRVETRIQGGDAGTTYTVTYLATLLNGRDITVYLELDVSGP
jgi:hypothetical protein